MLYIILMRITHRGWVSFSSSAGANDDNIGYRVAHVTVIL